MKSIFAGLGFIIVILLIVNSIAPGSIGGAYDRFIRPGGYEQGYTDNAYGYDGVGIHPGCETGGCQTGFAPQLAPPRSIQTHFEYGETRSAPNYGRVWVQPEYRQVYSYGRPQTVIVRQGYWRTTETRGGKERHVGFDLAGLLGQR